MTTRNDLSAVFKSFESLATHNESLVAQVEALTKECDDAVYACGLVVQRYDKLVIERDELAAAVKLAIGEMEYNQYAVADIAPHADVMAFCEAIETLKKVVLK